MMLELSGAPAESLADSIEAAAMRDLYNASPMELGARWRNIARATALIVPTLPVSYFNRVIGLGNAAPVEERDLDDVMGAYAAAGVESYWIHLTTSARPSDLGIRLSRRGFQLATRPSWAKFLRGVEPPLAPTTALFLRKAGAEDAEAVSAVVCTAYGMPSSIAPWFATLVGRPGWEVWLAECEDGIVATGSFFVRGRTAWLGVGATLAEYRGRGAQTALLAARIRAAAAAGCRVLATETGEPVGAEANPSLANIRRAGFVQVGSRLNIAWSGAHARP